MRLKVILTECYFFYFLFTTSCIYAQKKEVDVGEKKSAIEFLMSKNEIPNRDSNWHSYLKSISFKKIYKNKILPKNDIFLFNLISPHFTYYLLLRQDSKLTILETINFESDFKIIMKLLKKDKAINSEELLTLLDKLIDIYDHNKNIDWKEKESPPNTDG